MKKLKSTLLLLAFVFIAKINVATPDDLKKIEQKMSEIIKRILKNPRMVFSLLYILLYIVCDHFVIS